MIAGNDSESISGEVSDLRVQIEQLQGQLHDQQTISQAMWELLILLGSQLQLSSTSIKMAVSSLLDYDIFWDPSTSHEFLQVIDTSTDRTADLVVLLTLAFRSQAKSLEISIEPQMLQEILEALQSSIAKRNFEARLIVDYPSDGKLAAVDYQYLIVALRLLFEVVVSENKSLKQLALRAFESAENWQLRIGEMELSMADSIRHFLEFPNDFKEYSGQLMPENTLKLIVACRILRLQHIKLVEVPREEATLLSLSIPFAKRVG